MKRSTGKITTVFALSVGLGVLGPPAPAQNTTTPGTATTGHMSIQREVGIYNDWLANHSDQVMNGTAYDNFIKSHPQARWLRLHPNEAKNRMNNWKDAFQHPNERVLRLHPDWKPGNAQYARYVQAQIAIRDKMPYDRYARLHPGMKDPQAAYNRWLEQEYEKWLKAHPNGQ